MTAFLFIQIGQTISILGSSMTGFALSIWAYQLTGSATALALVAFFNFGPTVLLSPIAGALVDRSNRKLVMMISDLGAALGTMTIFILYTSGNLQIWHLYIVGALTGAAQAFQFPAYSAAITMMIPKEQYGRASGLMSLAEPAASIFAPLLAGALIGRIGIGGILIIDILTFSAAFTALILVHIPQPETSAEGRAARGSLWSESLYGFRYIAGRPSLLGLQLMFLYINLVGSISFTVMTPMILARTGFDALALGSVMSAGSIGGLAGGLLMSAWGGPKRRVHGILLGMVAASLFSSIPLGLAGPLAVWSFGNFMFGVILPVLNGSSQALWQAKVPPDLQGRVFSVRRLIAQITAPVGMLAAGPLADRVFEPLMQAGQPLTQTVGWLVGSGPGAGMGLMFLITGVFGIIGGLAGYLVPAIRNAEDILPDHNVRPEQLEQPAAEAPAPAA
ncbi:MAG: MFS transporter [Chloroflexi bacterium]|nr:MFS transporter [Chloroflexota bacterium]